jgi:hypothetical protein
MEDEMSVTVIATGSTEVSPEESFTVEEEEVAAPKPRKLVENPGTAAAKAAQRPQSRPAEDDEDDTYSDIMSIFNNKK